MEVAEPMLHDDAVNNVVEILQDSLIPDSEIQKRVQEKLGPLQNQPEFVSQLLQILGNPQLYDVHVRALSAIMLKNTILTTFSALPLPVLNRMRQECLRNMTDSSKDVRASVTSLIGTIVWKGDVSSWPELVPRLCALIDSPDIQLSETALNALFKICEDHLSKRGTEKEVQSDAIDVLVSKFVSLVTSERTVIRRDSIKLVNLAMQEGASAFGKLQIDSKLYLSNLFQVIKDEDAEIQKLVCQAFCGFVEMRDTAVSGHIQEVIEFMLRKTAHEDAEIALQACEFWLVMGKLPSCRDILQPYIERLLPILLTNMKYSNCELDTLRNCVGIDEHLEDKPDDISPFNMRSSGQRESDDFDDYGFCNGEGDTYEQADVISEAFIGWTLRKCSAASLDALSVKFQEELLPAFLPLLDQALNSDEFLVKESAILALGAIADGCLGGLKRYLPKLINYLLGCMNSEQSLVRVITCWTISRYMGWLMKDEQAVRTYFKPVMMILLEHFLDSNKRVQRAALSGFCIFQEEARLKLLPYVDFILQAFLLCFKKYKFRSYLMLYDAIGVLAQSIGNNLNKPDYIHLLMPPLMHKVHLTTNWHDEQFMALIECLSNVAIALEVGFLPYAEVTYNRCLEVINETVASIQRNIEDPYMHDVPDRDPMCVAHDMMLGMAIGLKNYFVKFVTNSDLLLSMYYTLQDEMVQVRQPALALYGELVKLCFEHMSSTVHECIPMIIENLDRRHEIACNNAAWVLCKLCIAMGCKIEPYAGKILEHFVEIFQTMNGAKTIYQTVAISLCTLGLVCPDQVAPHLATVLRPCCQAMRNVGDSDDKDVGFRGLCELVLRNPAAAVGDFLYFCDAVASWNDMRPDLKETVRGILLGFRAELGEANWVQFYDQLPLPLKMRLNKLYGI